MRDLNVNKRVEAPLKFKTQHLELPVTVKLIEGSLGSQTKNR